MSASKPAVVGEFRASVSKLKVKPRPRPPEPKPTTNEKILAARKPYKRPMKEAKFKQQRQKEWLMLKDLARFGNNPPLRLRLYLARIERKLSMHQCGLVFHVGHNCIAGWEAGPNNEFARDKLGWDIMPAWQPLIEEWIQTGRAPSKEACDAAKNFQPYRPKKLPEPEGIGAIHDMSSDPTIGEILPVYLTWAKRRLKPDHYARKVRILNKFVQALGADRKISEFKPLHLENYLDSQPTWKSPWTAWGHITAIQSLLNWAVDYDIIPKNPVRKVKRRPGKNRPPVTPDEYQSLMRACSIRPDAMKRTQWNNRPSHFARLRQLICFAWHTGGRPDEIRRIKWTDVDFSTGIVTLEEHKTVTTMRNPQPRLIYMDPVALRLLRSIRKNDPSPDYVFRNSRGIPWTKNSLCMKLRRVREKAGLRRSLSAYGLRHGYGTRATKRGIDLMTLKELMGHTSTRTTEVYVHLRGDHPHLSAAVRKINERNAKPEGGAA